jgi:hypothetical protein
MTQALYAHMNNKIKKKKPKNPMSFLGHFCQTDFTLHEWYHLDSLHVWCIFLIKVSDIKFCFAGAECF